MRFIERKESEREKKKRLLHLSDKFTYKAIGRVGGGEAVERRTKAWKSLKMHSMEMALAL